MTASRDTPDQETAATDRGGLHEFAASLAEPAGRVYLLLTLVLFGVPGVLWKLFDDTGAPLMWQTIVLTAPMTIAVTAIAYLVLTDRLPGPVGIGAIIVAAAAVTWLIGLHSGAQVAPAFRSYDANCTAFSVGGSGTEICDPGTITPYPWYEIPFRLVVLYWNLYGPRQFAAALIVGVFIAWLWARRIATLRRTASVKP